MSCSDIIVIVMAAGQSRRFGSDKRIAQLSNGKTLLTSTLLTIQQHFPNITVVLKEGDKAQSLGLSPITPTLVSQRSHLGLGYSISDAFKYLCSDEKFNHYRSAAVWLADLPWVTQKTCKLLADMSSAENIVQPTHLQVPGHPVIFGRKFWKHIADLRHPSGASAILQRYSDHIVKISLNDPGVCYDIDTPDSLSPPF
ncbi:MAG: nucleotidyltransferase family protein [Gammaproteobacteria bacterium]|uniref:MobA-like NTP transferase domain-containing protein n=1 Tax=Vreelandella venusta TaxID=44935 RepID=A0ABX2B7E5_9GAMM|nr:nucleotidyltransferase family protein [Halomonas venusta]AZM94518.1 nucleotidyltransferase family protein [Halomonas venusta]MBR9926489.1 nucleotidyltransferase family protein [Gammaproteobacteria bacterium]MDX1714561.1 nucleotidyltransferase family protein [Halomonas venusta]NPT28994.1 hypothetical protein [Halomonas venusta]